jgi:hypothetical protein
MASGEPYDGRERRRARRYKVNLHARWEGEWASREATVTDLSDYGCFILTEDLVKVGEMVRLELRLPRGGQITLWGSVVYRVEEIGFALTFSRFLHEDDRKRLEWLVRAEAHRSEMMNNDE